MGLIVYLLAFWAITALVQQYLYPRPWKVKRFLKSLRHHIRDRRTWDRDVLTAAQLQELDDLGVYVDGLIRDHAELPVLRAKTVPESEQAEYAATIAAMEQRLDLDDALKPLSKTMKVPAPPTAASKKAAAKGVDDPAAATMKKMKKKANSGKSEMSPADILGHVKGVLEMLVVVLGVVMGLRGLFLQPFKIPTGSMQPTLYGVHFVPSETDLAPSPIRQAWDWVNYGKRWSRITAPTAGTVEYTRFRAPGIGVVRMIFPNTIVQVGSSVIALPGTLDEVVKYLRHEHLGYAAPLMPIELEAGEVVVQGHLIEGDHLFVDRVSYNFREPQRGDIVVFNTSGILDENNEALKGLFYIKRLVGLPGETIRIHDRKLYVRERGAADFRLVTGADDHPGFDRMYSMKGDYRGYVSVDPRVDYEHTIPDGEYLMMGDNSENSKDGRYFGTVQRENIVGRACIVWWPFSRRFGLVDRAEPLDYPSEINRGYDRAD